MVNADVVPVTLVGFAVTVSPLGALIVSATGAANPLMRVTVAVAVVVLPCCTLSVVGETANAIPGAVVLNVAVTLPEMPGVGVVNVHVSPVPAQAPAQLAKALPAAGAAERVSDVPAGNCTLQTLPQLMPAGSDVTFPDPEPALVTVTGGAAVTVIAMLVLEESFPLRPRRNNVYGPIPALRATRILSVLVAELLARAGELSVAVRLSGMVPSDNDTVPLALPTIDTVAVAV